MMLLCSQCPGNRSPRAHFRLPHLPASPDFFEGTITAVGWVTHAGRRNILASAELHDTDGHLIATGQGSFARSRIPSPECGYE